MSQMISSIVSCPRCAASWSAELFSSVDADTVPVQVDAIIGGRFERMTCHRCGESFRPEHALLLVSRAHRLSIVMQPPAYRCGFAGLERDLEHAITSNPASATPIVTGRLAGIRPRLVFGQHMLAEAVRVSEAGLDAGLLECAKLLTVRRDLSMVMRHGPFELCIERFDGDTPICAVHAVPSGERVAELALASEALARAWAGEGVLRQLFPELFTRPYVSATRYLLADTA